MAKDFISRICKISSFQRYDAKRALGHPWITRNFDDKIPLTRVEEIHQQEVRNMLSKISRVAAFMSIVK